MAEAILDHLGRGRFKGHSAGSFPKGRVHPMALHVLEQQGLRTDGLRSKSWDTFAVPGAPRMDFIFTVCDQAAGEACPVWPGHPVTAHWGLPDPAAVPGPSAEQAMAFRKTFRILEARIRFFLTFSFKTWTQDDLRRKAADAGRPTDSGTP